MNRTLVAVAVLAAGLLAGCTHTSAGEPRPEDPSGTVSESSEQTRPREITLDGKDPCALIPDSDWPKFYIEKPGKPQQSEQYKSPECFYSNSVGAFIVTLVMTEGIDVWLDGSRAAEVEEVEPVAGYRAIALTIDADPSRCDVAVDVADGQYLKAAVLPDNIKTSELPERCEYAHQLAESAMSTLVRS